MNDLAKLFTWRKDRVVVAAITGEIDISNAKSLERSIAHELDGEVTGLVVDLAGLAFLDGSGVHLLYSLSDTTGARGIAFALVLPESSPPRRVLELSGQRVAGWIHTSEDAAIEAVLNA